MGISHVKSNTIADFTGTVTVFGSDGATATAAATNLVRPSDWNSSHNIAFDLSGNTAGSAAISGNNITLVGGNNVTLSAETAASKLHIIGPSPGGAGYTALTYQNRQLGASTQSFVQNAIWVTPMRIAVDVQADTILQMVSIGTSTSTNTGSCGVTLDMALYKVTGTNTSRFDTIWSTRWVGTGYISSSNSAAYTIDGGASGQQLTTASANSNLGTRFAGMRMITMSMGSTLGTGLYAYAVRVSTSSVGNSVAFRTFGIVLDNPMPLGMGLGFGGGTATSIGFQDAGTIGTTSASFPSSFGFGDIKQHSNLVPYVKAGAI